jgi:hypothetical protein
MNDKQKTFQSKEMGLAVSYPSDWFTDEDDGILYMGSEEGILEDPLSATNGIGLIIRSEPSAGGELESVLAQFRQSFKHEGLATASLDPAEAAASLTLDRYPAEQLWLQAAGKVPLLVLLAVLDDGNRTVQLCGLLPQAEAEKGSPLLEAVIQSITLGERGRSSSAPADDAAGTR